jgi:hypothetical protein
LPVFAYRAITHHTSSVPGGIRTHGLHRDRVASTPDCSTRTFERGGQFRVPHSQCPGWDSNPHPLGFKPSRSAIVGAPGRQHLLLITLSKRKPWDSNPQATRSRLPVFKTGSSSGRMASVKLRGLESNQRTPGSEPGVTYQQRLPRTVLSAEFGARSEERICPHRPSWQFRAPRSPLRAAQGSGRRIRTSASWFKARRPALSRSPNAANDECLSPNV